MTRSALFLFTALSVALHLLLFLVLPEREDSTVQAPVPLRVGLIREFVEDTATATMKSVSSAASAASRAKNTPTEPPQPPDKELSPAQEKTPLPQVDPPLPKPVKKEPIIAESVAREEPLPIQETVGNPHPAPQETAEIVQEKESPSDSELQEGPTQAEAASEGDETSPLSLPSEAVSGGAELVQAAPDYALNPPPYYPRAARSRGWEGTVTLRVHVSVSGRATKVTLEHSSGYSLLDRSALKAVRRWRFHPALLGEKTVESDVLVPVIFRMRGS